MSTKSALLTNDDDCYYLCFESVSKGKTRQEIVLFDAYAAPESQPDD